MAFIILTACVRGINGGYFDIYIRVEFHMIKPVFVINIHCIFAFFRGVLNVYSGRVRRKFGLGTNNLILL